MRRTIGLVLLALALAGCKNPAADIPANGLAAALHFCPIDECSDVRVGGSTKQLPFQASEGIYDRWCVEVLFSRSGRPGQAAVEIQQLEAEDGPFSWGASEPILNSDCTVYQ